MEEIEVMEDLLAENDKLAVENRNWFKEHGVFVVELVGSPGCGKTALLEQLLKKLAPEVSLAVIEGDLYTDKDAQRLEGIGPEIFQINTGGACHLEAAQIQEAAFELDAAKLDLLIIENVGNLVCPASFDLGAELKITVLSVPEGNDKPLKYPALFEKAGAVIVNKIDLLPETDFSLAEFSRDLRSLRAEVDLFEVSCTTGEGIEEVAAYLKEQIAKK